MVGLLIKHVSPAEYWFSGSFSTATMSGSPKPLTVTGSFHSALTFYEEEEVDLLFKGTYRFAQGNTSHPFVLRASRCVSTTTAGEVGEWHRVPTMAGIELLEWPSESTTATVEVSSAFIGTVSGHIYEFGPGYDMLAVGPTAHSVSAHIELLPDFALRVTGVIAFPGGSIGFVAIGSPDSDKQVLGNVVRILGGRRA